MGNVYGLGMFDLNDGLLHGIKILLIHVKFACFRLGTYAKFQICIRIRWGKVRPDFLSHDGGADDGMSVARC
jgi:hypothetical protein